MRSCLGINSVTSSSSISITWWVFLVGLVVVDFGFILLFVCLFLFCGFCLFCFKQKQTRLFHSHAWECLSGNIHTSDILPNLYESFLCFICSTTWPTLGNSLSFLPGLKLQSAAWPLWDSPELMGFYSTIASMIRQNCIMLLSTEGTIGFPLRSLVFGICQVLEWFGACYFYVINFIVQWKKPTN